MVAADGVGLLVAADGAGLLVATDAATGLLVATDGAAGLYGAAGKAGLSRAPGEAGWIAADGAGLLVAVVGAAGIKALWLSGRSGKIARTCDSAEVCRSGQVKVLMVMTVAAFTSAFVMLWSNSRGSEGRARVAARCMAEWFGGASFGGS